MADKGQPAEPAPPEAGQVVHWVNGLKLCLSGADLQAMLRRRIEHLRSDLGAGEVLEAVPMLRANPTARDDARKMARGMAAVCELYAKHLVPEATYELGDEGVDRLVGLLGMRPQVMVQNPRLSRGTPPTPPGFQH